MFLPSFTVSCLQTVALLLNDYSTLLLKANATEVLVDQYGRKMCDLTELLTPLATNTLLYSRK